ncbi:MASE1 domain-containing protein [Archangium violaceum]|uniref:sensor histidine kinase n=1 Tax=Archangium violaceum TaxID=83451 RepID=UPI002B2F876A|nr:MASE1 domain-containing protein [Archangium gephyra]
MHTFISGDDSMVEMGRDRAGESRAEVWGRALLLFAAFCGLKALSAFFVFPPLESASVWLPSGLTLAVFLRAAPSRWPVYLAAVFAAEVMLVPLHGDPWDMALLWGLGNCLRTVVGAGLMRRWLDGPVTFSRPREVVALLLAGGLLSPLPSATLGVGAVALLGPEPLSTGDFWRGWLGWYLSDGLGAVLFAPLLLTWSAPRPEPRRQLEGMELVGMMLLLALVAHLAFGLPEPRGILMSLPYLCLPFALGAALRLGPRGAATSAMVLGALAVWHTAARRGPFGVMDATLPERVISVQLFLAVAALSTLILAAMACDRRRVEREQRLLAESGAVLAESLEPRETLPRVARLLVPELFSGFAVWLLEGDGRLVPAARLGLPEEAEGRLREDILRLSEPSRRRLGPEGASVLARIQHQGRLLGGLALVRAGHTHVARSRVMAFAEDLAHHCALAVENAHLLGQFQSAIQVRDEFITVAAHELRTPVTVLTLQLQNLQRPLRQGAAGEPVLARFQAVSRQVSRLGRLVEGLLDVGRLNTGRLPLEREPVELGTLVQDVVERFSEELGRAGCEVVLSLQPHVTGMWDRERLEQALGHLLGNAVKFGVGRPIRLQVSQWDGTARLVVEDQGIGVSPEALERIFGRFERAVPSREYGGLGLGLFLTRRIVEAHGGTIQATSQPGEGATFVLELPASSLGTYVPGPSPWPHPPPADSYPT